MGTGKKGQFTTRSMYRMLAHRGGGGKLPHEENLGLQVTLEGQNLHVVDCPKQTVDDY